MKEREDDLNSVIERNLKLIEDLIADKAELSNKVEVLNLEL